jgi:hypothetical protein
MDGISPDFSNDLCPDDLDRVMDVLEGAFARMPVLMETGIKRVVNGPITYTIDGAPLVGPIPGKSATRSASSACARDLAKAAAMAGSWRSRSSTAKPATTHG